MASTVIDGQTCLEKRGITERGIEIEKNLYNNVDLSKQYSSTHPNAISEPNDPKGKGTRSGGHTYFRGYYGVPRGDINTIDYSNFVTYDDGITIGNAADTTARNASFMARIYNRVDNIYSETNKDALSNGEIIGKGTGLYLDTENGGGGIDIRQRTLHIRQNLWRKNDVEYSKPLIDAEYDIQTEFKVGTADQSVQDQVESKEKKQKSYAKKAPGGSVPDIQSEKPPSEKPNKPVEILKPQ